MPEQIVRIMCPNVACRCVLGVPERARGKIVRCRSCGTNVRIPAPATPPAPAVPAKTPGKPAA